MLRSVSEISPPRAGFLLSEAQPNQGTRMLNNIAAVSGLAQALPQNTYDKVWLKVHEQTATRETDDIRSELWKLSNRFDTSLRAICEEIDALKQKKK